MRQDLETAPATATTSAPHSSRRPTIRERAIEEVAAELEVAPLVFMRDYLGYPEYALMLRERERVMMAAAEHARIIIDEPSAPHGLWGKIVFIALIAFIVVGVIFIASRTASMPWR